MKQRPKKIRLSDDAGLSYLYRLMDAVLILMVLLLCTFLRLGSVSQQYFLLGLLGMLLFLVIAEIMGVYHSLWMRNSLSVLTATFASWIGVCFSILLIGFFGKMTDTYSRLIIGFCFLCGLMSLIVWRIVFTHFLYRIRKTGKNKRHAAIIGLTDIGIMLYKEIVEHEELGIQVCGFFDNRTGDRLPEGYLDQLAGSVEEAVKMTVDGKIDIVFVALALKYQERISAILTQFGDSTANVYLVPNFFVFNLLRARWGNVGNIQTLSIYESPFEGMNRMVKRFEDIIIGVLILMVTLIPMMLIAIGIKLSSKGPVIFKQHRYGLNGKKIKVWKFRTMTVMEDGTKVVQVQKNDSRVTSFGKILRQTSLDELPQLFNVLEGSMSIVGPRLHAVVHNETYRKLVNFYMLRHMVKPGLVGLAQIRGFRGATDTLEKMERRIEYDLEYIRNWSVWLDLKIILLTVFKGFVGKNVY